MLHDEVPRTLQQRALEDDPTRPLSAMGFGFSKGASGSDPSDKPPSGLDVEMEDAGPSTAPLQGASRTFFPEE